MSQAKFEIGYRPDNDRRRDEVIAETMRRLNMRKTAELSGEGSRRIDMATGREVPQQKARRARA